MIRNIYHCIAIGGCSHLASRQPSAHNRKARLCRQLGDALLHDLTFELPVVTERTLEIGQRAAQVVSETGERIAREQQIPADLVVLNVICFCIDELPVRSRHKDLLSKIIACYDGVDQYQATRAGHRAWLRMTTECEILQIAAA